MKNMDYIPKSRRRLTEVLEEAAIHSIIIIPGKHGKAALLIAYNHWNVPNFLWKYSKDGRIVSQTIYINLSRFSYHAEFYVAIPKEHWKDIYIEEKEYYPNGTTILEVKINKPLY